MSCTIDVSAYIRTAWWCRRRRKYYQGHRRVCAVCRGVTRIQLHHLTYERMYAERDSDLIPLCRKHHKLAHRAVNAGKCSLWNSVDHIKQKYDQRRIVKARRRRRKAA